jgi:hypothetical protein
MCAFMALIAPEELGLDERRVTRFLESYIGSSVSLDIHCLADITRSQTFFNV